MKCDYKSICILVLLRDICNPPGYVRPKKPVFTCYVNEGDVKVQQVENGGWKSPGRRMNVLALTAADKALQHDVL